MPQYHYCPKCSGATERVEIRGQFYGIRCKSRKDCKWSVPASEVDDIADVAQTGEQFTRNEQVASSTLAIGLEIPKSSNGRTADFESVNGGSIPSLGANGLIETNGHTNGHVVEPNIDEFVRWKNALEILAKALYRADPEYQKGHLTWDTVADAIWADISIAIRQAETGDPLQLLYKPPVGLTATDIQDEAMRVAESAWEWFRSHDRNDLIVANGYQLPAVNDADEFADRHAIDAYDVYQQMLGEKKTYSWAGLCRDGGTALISAVIGAGKTTLALNIARGWANAEVVLGRQCRQSRVLVIVSPKEYDNWAETVGMWELRGAIWIIESPKAHFGSPAKAATWFEAEMKRIDARCFVLDTLFDFYGHSTSNASSELNREVMNEQSPLLMKVRENNWSGIVTGHSPKSEAQAINPRDPEEAFSGANSWAAQHRMRIRLRRAGEITGIMSGRGGYGDEGILEEQLLQYEPTHRLVTLGGSWAEKEGLGAWPIVKRTMEALDGGASMAKLVEMTGKSETFLRAGLRIGKEERLVTRIGKGRSTRYVLRSTSGTPGMLISDEDGGQFDG